MQGRPACRIAGTALGHPGDLNTPATVKYRSSRSMTSNSPSPACCSCVRTSDAVNAARKEAS